MRCWCRPGRARSRSRSGERGGGSVGRSGFTLIEVLAALILVGVAAVAVAGMGAELRTWFGVRQHVDGVALAEAKLAEVAALPTPALLRLGDRAGGRFAAPFGAYHWEARARRAPDAPAVVQAGVMVDWPGGRYVLTTELYRPEAGGGGFARPGAW